MKKQFLAKLLVLVMVLSMIPGTLLVANAATNGNDGSVSNNGSVDEDGNTPSDTTPSTPGTDSEDKDLGDMTVSSEVAEVTAVSVDTDDITVEEGSAKIKVAVTNGQAKLALTTKAVNALADAVKGGELTLELDDEGATSLEITMPAKAMTNLAKESGADLTIKSSVAEISIPNNVLASALGKAGNVTIKAEHTDKSIGFSIATGGKSLKNVHGIKVEF